MLQSGVADGAAEFRRSISKFGADLSSDVMQAMLAAYAPYHQGRGDDDGIAITSDIPYGNSARQTLNLFVPQGTSGKPPIFIFVPGGGFVEGGARLPGTPFYDNIGKWAARNGMVGVVMGYRLYPDVSWPAVTDDLEAVIGWLGNNPEIHHGDAERIFVLGSSAGAIALADLLARPSAGVRASIAGAILRSGIYDLEALPDGVLRTSLSRYFSGDPAALHWQSDASSLASSGVPLLVLTAEFDPEDFHAQATELAGTMGLAGAADVQRAVLEGHNHFSADFEIGTAASPVGELLMAFIRGRGGVP